MIGDLVLGLWLLLLVAVSDVMTSSTAMPNYNLTNWGLIFNDDFTTNVALGGFPGPYSQKWTSYSGFQSTDKIGWYDMTKVLSVSNSILDFYIHTDASTGHPLSAAPVPFIKQNGQWGGQKYGRYSIRFRSDSLPGYKTAFLLWPDSDNWNEGEIDYPEGSLDGKFSAFSHCTTGQPSNTCFYATNLGNYSNWHIATVELAPTYMNIILDDVIVGTTTTASAIPTTLMHWVLQAETWYQVPSPSVAGHLQVDWVAIWEYNTNSRPPTPAPTPKPTPKPTIAPCTAAQGAWSDNFNPINTAKWTVANNVDWAGSLVFQSTQVKSGTSGLTFNSTTLGCPSACSGDPVRSGKIDTASAYGTGTLQFSAQTATNGVLWVYWEVQSPFREGWEVYFTGDKLSVQYYKNSAYNWGGTFTLPLDTISASRKFTILRTDTSFKLYQSTTLIYSASGSTLPTTNGIITFALSEGGATTTPRTEIAKLATFTYLPAGCPYSLA